MDIKTIRLRTHLSQASFAEKYAIPVRTLQNWEVGHRNPPDYVIQMLDRLVDIDFKEK